jgi:hypothetical protein
LILKQGKPVERRRRKITGLQGAKPGAPGQRDHQEIDMATSVSTTPDFAKPPSGSIPPHAPRTAAANAAGAAKAPPPAAGSEQKPAFLDAAECAAWLARVPLANVSLAQPILLRQLNLLHRHELPPGERFAILEALRQPIIEVQAAMPPPSSPAGRCPWPTRSRPRWNARWRCGASWRRATCAASPRCAMQAAGATCH